MYWRFSVGFVLQQTCIYLLLSLGHLAASSLLVSLLLEAQPPGEQQPARQHLLATTVPRQADSPGPDCYADQACV